MELTPNKTGTDAPIKTKPARWIHPYTALVILLLGAVLYLPGIRWGLPATVSWSQDTIAGHRTLGSAETWPDHWSGRYPPLHYLLVRASYEPILQYWQGTGDLIRNTDTGESHYKPPHEPKIGLLILISRLISALMAISAALGLAAATRRITGDELTAAIATITLMIGACFAYLSHLGNVDIPSVMWFCWSLYFYARLIQTRHWRDALLLGLFGSLAISTKDSLAGIYPGMAVVLLIEEFNNLRADWPVSRAWIRSLLQPRWLIGIAAFALPYLFINGAFHNFDAYTNRMAYWLGLTPDTLHMKQDRYANQFSLLIATVHYTAAAVGWPMLVAMIAAKIYVVKKHKRIALTMMLPVVSYYLIIIAPQHFVYSRFLFPMLACVCVMLGIAAADLWRRTNLSLAIRLGLPFVIILPTLGYTVAVDLSLMTDTRYEAETWFENSADKSASVGAFSKPQYLPRLTKAGVSTYMVEMTRETFDRPQPDYLILTSYNYEDFDDEQNECMHALISGELGYEPIQTFRGSYIGTSSSWLSLAGWYTPTIGKISPTITVLRRVDSD